MWSSPQVRKNQHVSVMGVAESNKSANSRFHELGILAFRIDSTIQPSALDLSFMHTVVLETVVPHNPPYIFSGASLLFFSHAVFCQPCFLLNLADLIVNSFLFPTVSGLMFNLVYLSILALA